MVATAVRTIFAQPDAAAVADQLDSVVLRRSGPGKQPGQGGEHWVVLQRVERGVGGITKTVHRLRPKLLSAGVPFGAALV